MDNKDSNKSTKQTRDNIREAAQKNTQNLMIQIDSMRGSKEKMTFFSSAKYLWSFIILGINWMVYQKVFLTLLTVAILVATLVLLPPIGIILCILTPVIMAFYGKYLYNRTDDKYSNSDKSNKQRLLIPSSLLIIWVLLGFMVVLLIGTLIETIIM